MIRFQSIYLRSATILTASLMLAACATRGTSPGTPVPSSQGQVYSPLPDAGPQPETVPHITDKVESQTHSGPVSPESPHIDVIQESLSSFSHLSNWSTTNLVPALKSLRQSCTLWQQRDEDQFLAAALPEYGQYKDWQPACFMADRIPEDQLAARQFFESFFQPVRLSSEAVSEGLLTGYYVPEINVRYAADAIYSEPILRMPEDPAALALPRSEVKIGPGQIIAYGKPIDVFFMQVQGSGRIVFEDGKKIRAAFAAHNSQPYSSIGRALVERGEMSLEQASKQSIESWMARHSYQQVRDLMHVNRRYVYFKEEPVSDDEGPKGAMGVPLEAMGSLAVDKRYHPYGALIWLETYLPQKGGDYNGQKAGLLVSAQDTGGAIKGALRGDLFFGAGMQAGDRAGVMKHPAKWSALIPKELAINYMVDLSLRDMTKPIPRIKPVLTASNLVVDPQ